MGAMEEIGSKYEPPWNRATSVLTLARFSEPRFLAKGRDCTKTVRPARLTWDTLIQCMHAAIFGLDKAVRLPVGFFRRRRKAD